MWKIPGKQNDGSQPNSGNFKGGNSVKAQKGNSKPNFNRRSGGGA